MSGGTSHDALWVVSPEHQCSLCAAAVFLANLQAHLQRPHTEVKANPAVQIGTEGPNDKSRCTGVAWLPASNGMLFAVAHQSGALFVYNKVRALQYSSRADRMQQGMLM